MPGSVFLDNLAETVSYRLADASMAPPLQTVQYIGMSTPVDAATSTITLQAPISCTPSTCPAEQNGDLLYVLLVFQSTASVNPAPAGWVVQDSLGVLGSQSVVLYSHWVQAGDPASWTWTLSASVPAAGIITAYRGVQQVETDGGIKNGVGGTVSAGTIATTKGSEVAVAYFTEWTSGIAFSVPAGMTLRTSTPTKSIVWFDTAVPVATGPNSFSATSTESGGASSSWTAHIFALQPTPFCPAHVVIADDGAEERIPQDKMNGANSGGYPAYTNTITNVASQPRYPNGILSASPLDAGTTGLR